METIKSYLETMFKGLPESEEVNRVKQGLLETMEDKYNALKAEGKSENEAVGQVISEFGNIDEITSELGIETENKPEAEAAAERFISDEEAREYITQHKKSGVVIGIGVMLCILAPAALIALTAFLEYGLAVTLSDSFKGTVGIGSLLLLIAIAVALFIVHGIKLERYEDYEKTPIKLSNSMRAQLTEENNAYTTKFAFSIAGGVGLIFVGIIVLIALGGSDYSGAMGTALMLAFIAAGVYQFVSAGVRRGSYEVLLETGDHKREKKQGKKTKAGRIEDAVNSIMWPLVVAGYLIWSFTTHDWHISWIVFPIAGLISAALDGILGAIAGEDNE